ncbi:MAG: 30S ribosomal protein S7 [Planctomycetota bacterium]|jgi:small subunit ribosomal protein S7|nr:30S ribosomal protein S7 [Planctomycetota bacterium]
MPRKYVSTAKYQSPDPQFSSLLASKFINCLMLDGKKSTAQRIFYEALEILGEKIPGEEVIDCFSTAVNNVKPSVEVRSRRVGGATLQVPHEIRRDRQQALAFRWILQATRKKKGKPVARKLAEELFDAYNKQGTAFTTRENAHKMAEANKAYAHFAW